MRRGTYSLKHFDRKRSINDEPNEERNSNNVIDFAGNEVYIQINDGSTLSLRSLEDGYARDSFAAMQRRWSKHVSEFARSKQEISDKREKYFPCRKLFFRSGNLQSTGNCNVDGEVEKIKQRFKQIYESEDNSTKENFFRNLAQPLSVRIFLKSDIDIVGDAFLSEGFRKRNENSLLRQLGTYLNSADMNLWHNLKDFLLWDKCLELIKANYGNNVYSYFTFLRTLYLANLIIIIVVMSFVTLPQLRNMKEKWSSTHNLEAKFDFVSSLLFYESYTNSSLKLGSFCKYDLPMAYLLTIFLIHLSTFVWVSISMTTFYRKNYISSMETIRQLAQILFCFWPYQISTQKAAIARHQFIEECMKNVLKNNHESRASLTFLKSIKKFGFDCLCHLTVALIICSGVILNYILLQSLKKLILSVELITILMSLGLKVSLWIIEIGLSWIGSLEANNSKIQSFRITLLRVFITLIAIFGDIALHFSDILGSKCWESKLGKNFCYLFLVNLLITCFVEPLVLFIISKTKRFPFDETDLHLIHANINLLYNLLLVSLSLLYVPLLSLLSIVNVASEFNIQRVLLKYFYKKCKSTNSKEQLQSLQVILCFLVLLGSIMIQTFIITHIPSSSDCGPFKDYTFIYEPLMQCILNFKRPNIIDKILLFVIKPYFVGTMLAIILFMVYYMYAKSHMHAETVQVLQELLYYDRKDKTFLLNEIKNITNSRQWLLNLEKEELKNSFSELSYRKRCSSYQ